MTGALDSFSELDHSVIGKERFSDGSVVEMRGRGTMVFAIDKDDHRFFVNVMYIPTLKSSVVSLGQLDEHNCDTRIQHGMLTIRDPRGRLIFEVN